MCKNKQIWILIFAFLILVISTYVPWEFISNTRRILIYSWIWDEPIVRSIKLNINYYRIFLEMTATTSLCVIGYLITSIISKSVKVSLNKPLNKKRFFMMFTIITVIYILLINFIYFIRLGNNVEPFNYLFLAYFICFMYISFYRLKDSGKSAMYLVIIVIPFFNILLLWKLFSSPSYKEIRKE